MVPICYLSLLNKFPQNLVTHNNMCGLSLWSGMAEKGPQTLGVSQD